MYSVLAYFQLVRKIVKRRLVCAKASGNNAAVFSRNCNQCVVRAGPTSSISVLVENMGHVNFEPGMNGDLKGARC